MHTAVTLPRFFLLPRLLALLLLLCPLPGFSQAMQDWGIDNVNLPYRQGNDGMASGGACYGMVRAKLEYHRLGLDTIRPFSEITTPPNAGDPNAESDRLFIEHFAALTQSYTLRNRNYYNEVYAKTADPRVMDRSLVASNVSTANPQILILSNEQAVAADRKDAAIASEDKRTFRSHAVLVEGRAEDAQYIRYTIADPNQRGARREVLYEKKSGTFLGFSGFDSVRHDTTPLPPQNQQWMEALLRGAMQPEKERYLPVWRSDTDLPLAPEAYKARKGKRIEPPVPSTNLNKQVSVLDSDTVGGVRLYFDPLIVADADRTATRWDMLRELTDQMTAGRVNLLVQAGGETRMQAVRLSQVLAGTSKSVGLTRLLGAAIDPDSGAVYLLGKKEEDRPEIPLDVLTVALRSMWRQQLAPAISLDPDPQDFYGSQHVRVESLPDPLRGTVFTETMLEADYAMKLIMLGEDKLDIIPGFQSHFDLLTAQPEAMTAEYFRFWLSPKGTTGADAYEMTAGRLRVFYFESDVKLLTETMKRAQALMIGTGSADPLAERAAQLFTRYYEQIEMLRPVFYRLHGVFDAAKLATVLRAKGVKSSELDAAANRALTATPLKATYAGIGPKIIPHAAAKDVFLFIGGGVLTAMRVTDADVARLPADAVHRDGDDWVVAVPMALPLDPKQALQVNTELETSAALEDAMANRLTDAAQRINRVLVAQPTNARARAVRAFVHLFRGNYAAALGDINLAMATEPSLRAVRGRIRMHAGDHAGALQDVTEAVKAFPDRPDILMQQVWVLVNAGRWTEAEMELRRLARLAPMDPEVDGMRGQLRLLRRMTPQAAQAYVKAQLALPLSVALEMAQVKLLMQAGNTDGAITRVKRVLAGIEQQKKAGTDPLFVEERCWVLLATLSMASDTKQSQAYLARLRQRHPDWPSALYISITLNPQLTMQQAVTLYQQANAMPDANDLFMLETRVTQGMDMRAQVGLLLIMSAGERMDRKPNVADITLMRTLVNAVAPLLPAGPAKHLLTGVRQAIHATELEVAGKLTPEERVKRDKFYEEQFTGIPPPGPKPDGTNLLVMQSVFLPLLENQTEEAETPEKFTVSDRFFTSAARVLNSDWNDMTTLDKAANHLMMAHLTYQKTLLRRLTESNGYKELTEQRQQEEVGIANAITALNAARDEILDAIPGLTEFEKRFLRASLYLNYPALLDGYETENVTASLIMVIRRETLRLCDGATSLVELKTARLWLDQAGAVIAAFDAQSPESQKIIVEFHRRGRQLDVQFLEQVAGP